MHTIYAYDSIITYLHISTNRFLGRHYFDTPGHVHFQPIQLPSKDLWWDTHEVLKTLSLQGLAFQASIVLYARVFHPNGSNSFPQEWLRLRRFPQQGNAPCNSWISGTSQQKTPSYPQSDQTRSWNRTWQLAIRNVDQTDLTNS